MTMPPAMANTPFKMDPVPPLNRPATAATPRHQQHRHQSPRAATVVKPLTAVEQRKFDDIQHAERLIYLSAQMQKLGHHFDAPTTKAIEPLDDGKDIRWWEPKATIAAVKLPRKPRIVQSARFLEPASPRVPAVPHSTRAASLLPAPPAEALPTDDPTAAPPPTSAIDDPFSKPVSFEAIAGLWVCFGAAICITELPDRSEGTVILSGKTIDPTLTAPIAEVTDARVTFLDRQQWFPSPSVGAYPAPPPENAQDKRAAALLDSQPKAGLAPHRVHIPGVLHCKDSTTVKVVMEVVAVQLVGLRFVLPCIAGPQLTRMPKKECCGTLLPPSKNGIRLRVDNAILFGGAQQMYHPVCVDVRPAGKVVLNYMGVEVAPDNKRAYAAGQTLIVLLQLADDKHGTKLADCTVLAYAGGAHGNRHRLQSSRHEADVTFDLNAFNHCMQRLASVTEYHTQIRMHCDKVCTAFKTLTDPLTRRRLMNVPNADDILLVDFELDTSSGHAHHMMDFGAWKAVRNARELATKLMASDETDRICGSFAMQPLRLTSDRPGMGKSWACEALQYFLAQPATEWHDDSVEGMAIVPLLLRVDWLERELGRLATERRLHEHVRDANDLLPWYIKPSLRHPFLTPRGAACDLLPSPPPLVPRGMPFSPLPPLVPRGRYIEHRYPGVHDANRRKMLTQAYEMRALVVIIDGLDEAATYSKLLLALIFDVLQPAGYRVVVASRPGQSYDELFRSFVTFKLTPLTTEQQRATYTRQVGADSPRFPFFSSLLSLAALRNGHDTVYREAFGHDMLDLQVEQLPSSNRLRVNGRPNGQARQSLRERFIQEIPDATAPRSATLKALCAQLTKERLHKLDVMLERIGGEASASDLSTTWFETHFVDEQLRSVAVRLATLALKRRTEDREAAEKVAITAAAADAKANGTLPEPPARLPPPKHPCSGLWRKVVSRTDELFQSCEEVQGFFEMSMRAVVERAGKAADVELRFGELDDPVRVHERGTHEYGHLFSDGVLGEANVLDMVNCRVICESAQAVVAVQQQMLTEGGLKLVMDDEARGEDGRGKITVDLEMWRGRSRFMEMDPTHCRSFINTLLVTVVIKGEAVTRSFKAFAEMQVHHAKIFAHEQTHEALNTLDDFRAMMPGVPETRRATHIDTAMGVLDDASSTPILLSLLVSIFDTPVANRPLPLSTHELYEMAGRIACTNVAAEHMQPNDIFRLLRLLAFETQKLGVPVDIAAERAMAEAIARQTHKGSAGPPPPEAKKYEDLLADPINPVRATDAFGQGDIDRILRKQGRLRQAWQKLTARGISLPFLQVLHRNADDVPDQWAFSHRNLQEGLAAVELIEVINSWSVWEDEKLAYRLMNEPSQSTVWTFVTPRIGAVLARRKPVWDFTFEAKKSALMWKKMSRVVRRDKSDEKKEEPFSACGVRVLAQLLRAQTSLISLVLADDMSDDALRQIGEGLLDNQKAELRALTSKPVSINTSIDANYNMSVPPGTERRMCLQPGHITLLAGVVRTMRTLNLCNHFAEAAGARALGRALPLSRSLTELRLDKNGLGDAGAAGLARGLFRNTSLTYLSVADNGIRGAGTAAIAEALRYSTRTGVVTLRLDGNIVGTAGSEALNALISAGSKLKRLELSLCGLTNAQLPGLLDALVAAKSLSALDLSANLLSEPSGVMLGEALPKVTTLTELDLSHNQLNNRALAALAIHDDDECGLRHNKSLFSLNLAHNDFSLVATDRTGVVPKVCASIAQNSCMQELHLHGSKFDAQVATLVGEALRVNASLRVLDVRSSALAPQLKQELHAAWAEVDSSMEPPPADEGDRKKKKRERVIIRYQATAMDQRAVAVFEAFQRRVRPTSPKRPARSPR